MNTLQAVYARALALKNHAYDRRWLQARSLSWPVLSIGNLGVGGAGKTPFVIELARLLADEGFEPDVLSRGYGRSSPALFENKIVRVDPNGSATRFGDEPLLIARATGVPVYVGANRWAAGILAEREARVPQEPEREAHAVHLLDDGFQHRRLARSADIVLLHPSDVDSTLLPTGRLREPLSALYRAHFLVLREDDARTEAALHRAGIRKPVWRVRRSLAPPPLDGPAIAFCAIAHPQEFFTALRAQGLSLQHTFAFRDHHRFRPRELAAIAASARGAAALLTTEKDLARLPAPDRRALERAAPLHAVPLRAELLDPIGCIAALLRHLAETSNAPMRK